MHHGSRRVRRRRPWSDHPECACPVLTAFMVNWNDVLPDDERQRLKPYITRLVGTRSTKDVEARRSWMACDWLVRTFTPAWLRRAGLNDDAAALEALSELTAPELVDAAMPAIKKARASARAWDAARDAAWAAAWAAAWDAARAAAGDAAWDAARDAAGAAARAAAWAAAWDAARDAAGAAARGSGPQPGTQPGPQPGTQPGPPGAFL